MARLPCPDGQWTGQLGNCQWCDKTLPAGGRRKTWCSDACRRTWERNHIWRHARIYARRRAKYRCTVPGCTAQRRDVEINHKTPRNGLPIHTIGCHHHQDPDAQGNGGLEALCHAHHAAVSKQQAKDRAAARKAAKQAVEQAEGRPAA